MLPLLRAFCAGLAVAGVAVASGPSSDSNGLEQWVATEQQHHQRLLDRGELPAAAVSAAPNNGTSLPHGCNYTLPPPVYTTVLCITSTIGPNYHPVLLAQAISAMPGILALSFAINLAPETGTFLTDTSLGLVGANLNSTTVTTLHIFLGPLRKVSGAGVASFTALNPQAAATVTDLGFSFRGNELADANLLTMGNIIGNEYYAVKKLSLDITYQWYETFGNLTGLGVAKMLNLLYSASAITDLWMDVSGNGVANAQNLALVGQQLGQWRALTALNFTNQNPTLAPNVRALPQVGDAGFLGFVQGLFKRGRVSALTNLTLNFAGNAITDTGLIASAQLFGSNLSSVTMMTTVLDAQVTPISPAGIISTLTALGSWQQQPANVWDLSIERPAQGTVNATFPNGTITPAQIVAPGSALANLTGALACTTNPAFFGNGVRLTQLQLSAANNNSAECAALAVASRAPLKLANGTVVTCPKGQLMLAYQSNVAGALSACGLNTEYYCGSCSAPPPLASW